MITKKTVFVLGAGASAPSWACGELKGQANQPVSAQTREHVTEWIEAHTAFV